MLLTLACVLTDAQTLDDSLPGSLSYDEVAPGFSIEDVNATSASFGVDVGPEDQRDTISAWYFGHST